MSTPRTRAAPQRWVASVAWILALATLGCQADKLPAQAEFADQAKCPDDKACDDQNACTRDNCDPKVGCSHSPQVSGCDDGDPCTTGDSCQDSKCVPGQKKNCDDLNPCTDDSCDTKSGECLKANNTAACSDQDACTENDKCLAGKCEAGPALKCDDANPCTDDKCDKVKGCETVANTVPCSDDDACTQGEKCSGGKCQGEAVKCDDGDLCTDDSCDKTKGCVKADNTAGCDDGSACTTGDQCKDGKCTGGPAPNCNDDNPCTDDKCEPSTGCVFLANTASCTDSDACTTGEACKDKACTGAVATDCDDKKACTKDSCDKVAGCKHDNVAGSCDDNDACTAGDTCKDGACVPGDKVVCDDKNPCTTDSCDMATGCTTTIANGVACTAEGSCKTKGVCDAGKCEAGDALWDLTVGDTGDDAMLAVAEEASSFVVAGYVTLTNVKTQGRLVRLDHAGKVKWIKDFGGAEHDRFAAVAFRPGGGYALAGTTGTGKLGGSDGWLVLTDSKGESPTEVFIGTTGNDNVYALAAVAGGWIVAGDVASADGKADGLLQIVTDDGKKTAVYVEAQSPGEDRFTDVASVPAGGYVAAGIFDNGSNGKDLRLVRFDTDLQKPSWSKTFGTAGTDNGGSLAVLADGFVLAGATNAKGAVLANAWVLRTDGAGNLLWSKTFGGNKSDNVQDVVVTADGSLRLVGSTESSTSGTDLWLIALSAQGVQEWQKVHGGLLNESGRGLAIGPSGHLLVVGTTAEGAKGGDDGWVLRLDAWGHKTCVEAGDCQAKTVKDCDDGQPCTVDTCTAAKGCQHATVSNTMCDDGNSCTSDVCTSGKGCQHLAPNNLPCDDGDVCTEGDTCQGGQCTAGKAKACDDGNACTADSCDSAKGCVAPNTTDGTACTLTGQACSVGAACEAGQCKSREKLWDAYFGGTGDDQLLAAVPVSGGYVAAGSITKEDKTVDGYVVRTDLSGKQVWAKSFGGSAEDRFFDALALEDGRIALVGHMSNLAAGLDGWLLLVDGSGALKFTGTYGGGGSDSLQALAAVPSGGWILVGQTTTGSAGATDAWLVRVDASGKPLWTKTFGGTAVDKATDVVALSDGFAIAGTTASKGAGKTDLWLIRTDDTGKLVWDKTFGGTDEDIDPDVLATPDGGFVLGGSTASKGMGGFDFWVIRTTATGDLIWDRTFGGAGQEMLHGLASATPGEGLRLVGQNASTESGATTNTDLWILATDAAGNPNWERKMGGGGGDAGLGVAVLEDGGLIVAGGGNGSLGGADGWLIRTDAWGSKACTESGGCADQSLASCVTKEPCTIMQCSGTKGCYGTTTAYPCEDGDACTAGDKCQGGGCQKGFPKLFEYLDVSQASGKISAAVQLQDGSVAVAANIALANGTYEVAVSRFSPHGQQIASHVYKSSLGYPGAYPKVISGLAATDDGGLVAVGHVVKPTPKEHKDFLAFKIKADNTMAWDTEIPDAVGDHWANGVVVLPSGQIVTAGGYRNLSIASDPPSGHLQTISPTGQWGTVLPAIGGTGSDEFFALHALPDGKVAVVGETDSKGNGGLDGWLRIVDPLKLTASVDKTYGGQGNDGFRSIDVLADGTLLVAGHTALTLSSSMDLLVMRLSPTGDVLMQASYGSGKSDIGHAIVALPDGFAVAGSYASGPGTKGWVMRGNKEGAIQWDKLFGKTNQDEFHTMIALPDGGLIVGGMAGNDLQAQKLWLVRTDAFGNTSCQTSGLCAGLSVSTCDDGNPCTVEGCSPSLGCTNKAVDDGTPCGKDAVCSGGVCTDVPQGMTLVPAGTFWMGCNGTQCVEGGNNGEKPQHLVSLSAYYIGLKEVTASDWTKCGTSGCGVPATCTLGTYGVTGKENHPVNCVSQTMAETYCNKMVPKGGRLPTEAEWERAARGGCEKYPGQACSEAMPTFPWGDAELTCQLANAAPLNQPCNGGSGTLPVGQFPNGKSPYGLFDMAGNVAEWTRDYAAPYTADAVTDPKGPGSGNTIVTRGGRYDYTSNMARTSAREARVPTDTLPVVGFRCACTADCDGWKRGNACYKAVAASKTWQQAEQECVNWGGHLTSVQSAAEDVYVRGLARQLCGATTADKGAWIGLHDTDTEGKFTWIDQTGVSYKNFAEGKPAGTSPDDDVVALGPSGWFDTGKDKALGCFVCRRVSGNLCK